MTSLDNRLCRWVLGALISLGLIGVVLAFAGCTVTPRPVYSESPSFDGNTQNSGVLGFHVSAAMAARFPGAAGATYLIQPDGTTIIDFPPGWKQPAGLKPDLGWHISQEADKRFLRDASVYGQDFSPQLDAARGVLELSDHTYLFDNEAITHFIEMERWAASAFKP